MRDKRLDSVATERLNSREGATVCRLQIVTLQANRRCSHLKCDFGSSVIDLVNSVFSWSERFTHWTHPADLLGEFGHVSLAAARIHSR